LLGETSGYVVDAKASKSILETLLSIIGIEVDMKNLEKRAKDTETLIETIEQQMSGKMVQQQTSATSRPSDMGYIS
jgi:proteasome assembly chaperone (PAC2) family protein